MRKYFIGLAVALWAPVAFAQTAEPAPKPSKPPPTTEEIAAARAFGDKLIDKAGAREFFTNVSEGAATRVRHDLSGMTCAFDQGDSRAEILVFDQGLGIPRGEDVACNSTVVDVYVTFYATRYAPPITAEQAMRDAVAAIMQRFPDAKWYEGVNVTMKGDRKGKPPLPQTWLAHYLVQMNGEEHYTQARVAEHNGWIYKARITAPSKNVTGAQVVGMLFWELLLTRLVDGAGPEADT